MPAISYGSGSVNTQLDVSLHTHHWHRRQYVSPDYTPMIIPIVIFGVLFVILIIVASLKRTRRERVFVAAAPAVAAQQAVAQASQAPQGGPLAAPQSPVDAEQKGSHPPPGHMQGQPGYYSNQPPGAPQTWYPPTGPPPQYTSFQEPVAPPTQT